MIERRSWRGGFCKLVDYKQGLMKWEMISEDPEDEIPLIVESWKWCLTFNTGWHEDYLSSHSRTCMFRMICAISAWIDLTVPCSCLMQGTSYLQVNRLIFIPFSIWPDSISTKESSTIVPRIGAVKLSHLARHLHAGSTHWKGSVMSDLKDLVTNPCESRHIYLCVEAQAA